jgi:hypothetical protein
MNIIVQQKEMAQKNEENLKENIKTGEMIQD